ncbi:hypothetical protein A2210_00420 [Candidatus Woesebacteria bacterium RIFOXYA1_FULL_40_18]|uniref:DUF5667 domain-containing protein n=3 Tax=Candidatus Woeseibacteriota TaxID=1752722 RepID=A0A0G0VJE8_9BACT|nr:MAG: hypothetical protein UT72_C0025G0003 [Candidatus Woesebacteria bacterium GW2011_GWB1_40_101]KKR62877.1 MAG: hypothetical protein UU03_C0021G0003 [Candidatus Woesebacteria bacterium GW2011_GWA1_40_45]OGM76994.1 MAG: hypothetical protein A2210_00420 [Candidatus Woesebacteria bacterium RIFOXYA1_FULL_40_18]
MKKTLVASLLVFELITPNLLIYPLKRFSEKIELTFAFTKAQKDKYLVRNFERRYNELTFIIENEKMGFLEEVAGRYNSYIGESLVGNTNPQIQRRAKEYLEVLRKLRDKYPSNSPYWLKIGEAVEVTRSLL